jgi:membrane fusion protein, multidrug efflux system
MDVTVSACSLAIVVSAIVRVMNAFRSTEVSLALLGRHVAGVAAFATIVALAAGCSKSIATAPVVVKPVAVEVAPITYSEAAVPVRASGVLSRKTEADLSFKVGGVVESVLVRVGDVVTKGQVLARLRLDEIDAQLTQARSAMDKTRRDLERAEKLDATGAAAAEALQNARTACEQAEAQLRIAEFNRSYAVIAAPADGRVLRRLAEPNELVAPGRAILAYASEADGWLVRAGLAERDLGRVRVGDAVSVKLAGAENMSVDGRVAHISEAVDPLTRTTQIEAELGAVPPGARSGFVVAVEVRPQPVASRPVVPATALIEGAAGAAKLFVVADGETAARRMAVEVEALFGTEAYLRTPLPRGARLVVTGAEYLRDGTSVAVTN